jgi:hypothetical protein
LEGDDNHIYDISCSTNTARTHSKGLWKHSRKLGGAVAKGVCHIPSAAVSTVKKSPRIAFQGVSQVAKGVLHIPGAAVSTVKKIPGAAVSTVKKSPRVTFQDAAQIPSAAARGVKDVSRMPAAAMKGVSTRFKSHRNMKIGLESIDD